jgi:hypothetical protein
MIMGTLGLIVFIALAFFLANRFVFGKKSNQNKLSSTNAKSSFDDSSARITLKQQVPVPRPSSPLLQVKKREDPVAVFHSRKHGERRGRSLRIDRSGRVYIDLGGHVVRRSLRNVSFV